MDQQLFDFMRDRFEAVEESQTGIHRKLDDLKDQNVKLDGRVSALEDDKETREEKKKSRKGFWTGVGTFVAATGYGIWSYFYPPK